MAEHRATIEWQCSSAEFRRGKYSREHTWSFDGGVTVPASASPSVVPAPWSNPAGVDPEEALVAAVASCHLITFLYVAQKQGFQVDRYRDAAVGKMTKNEAGVPWVSSIVLHPEITFGGERLPTEDEIEHLHHLAHQQCFIANSVKTDVTIGKPDAA